MSLSELKEVSRRILHAALAAADPGAAAAGMADAAIEKGQT